MGEVASCFKGTIKATAQRQASFGPQEPNMINLLYLDYGQRRISPPRGTFGDILKWADDTSNSPVWYDE